MKSSKTFNLFTYGTLMSPNCFNNFCPSEVKSVEATLEGFSRHPVGFAGYPAIVKNEEATVTGKLYMDIPEEYLTAFDRYEGEGSLYHRKEVRVGVPNRTELLPGKHIIPCYVYVWARGTQDLMLDRDWSVR